MNNRNIITINDNGVLNMPNGSILMTDCEIAHLLGLTYPSVRGAIKRLLKSRTLSDCSGNIVMGNMVVPEYFGLDVIIAVAFQLDSYECDIFRKWIIRNITADKNNAPIFIQFSKANVAQC